MNIFQHTSRRNILKGIAASGVALPTLARADRASRQNAIKDPHFFLMILVQGRADHSYLFDARPLAFTKANLIQNYSGEAPILWEDGNGGRTYVSKTANKFAKYKDEMLILNGVHMDPGFEGHNQNINVLTTGNAFGGELFQSELTDPALPLKFILSRNLNGAETKSLHLGVTINPRVAAALSEKLRSDRSGSDTLASRYLMARNAELSGRDSLFADGVSQLMNGMMDANSIREKLKQVHLPKISYEEEKANELKYSLKMANQYFTCGLTQTATIKLFYDLDCHDERRAKAQPQTYSKIIEDLDQMFQYLKTTPFGEGGQSLFDVITVMIASEFGRTCKQNKKNVDNTGTDHNNLGNSIIFAGKKVKGGQIVGATDLDALEGERFSNVSNLHQKMDSKLLKCIGKPIDFRTLQTSNRFPDEYQATDYLSHLTVINSVYKAFRADSSNYKTFGRQGEVAPVLEGLFT